MSTDRAEGRNQLEAREMFLLANAIKAAEEELVRDRPSREVVARRMEKQLGFKVTKANVASAAEVCGVVWRTRSPAGQGQVDKRPGGALYNRVARLEALVGGLKEAVNQVLNELGYPEVREPKVEEAEPEEGGEDDLVE